MSESQLRACFEEARRAAAAAGEWAGKRCKRLSTDLGEGACGYADVILLGHSEDTPRLQSLGLIEPSGEGRFTVIGLSRFGGVAVPLAVALASAQAAAEVISGRLPHISVSTRSFALSGAVSRAAALNDHVGIDLDQSAPGAGPA